MAITASWASLLKFKDPAIRIWLYDKDPEKFKDAQRYKTLTYQDAIEKDAIQVMDTAALAMVKENNMPVMVFKLFEGDNLGKAVDGEDIGTYMSIDSKTELA